MIAFAVRPLRSILRLLLRLRLPRAAFLHWLDVERPRLLLKKEAVGAGVAPARMLHAAGNEKIGPRPSPKSSSSAPPGASRHAIARAAAQAPTPPAVLTYLRVCRANARSAFSAAASARCAAVSTRVASDSARRATLSARAAACSARVAACAALSSFFAQPAERAVRIIRPVTLALIGRCIGACLLRDPRAGVHGVLLRDARCRRPAWRRGCASSPAGRGPSSGLPPFALVLLHPAASRTRSANDSTPTR